MSYRASFTNWLGEREYQTVDTADADYDRMVQQELDERKEAQVDSDTTRLEGQD